MPEITTRPADVADLAAIRAINAAGQPGVVAFAPEELAGLASGTIRCWVAQRSGNVSGYLIAYRQDEICEGDEFAWFQRAYPSFLYVDQIAVAPDRHRAGVGSALYGAASAYAVEHGLPMLTCEVNLDPPNPGSLAFHARLRFKRVGTLRTDDGRTVALLRLRLRLPLPASPSPHDSA
jgi:predicted GNAT superfamily acetyltransferase